MSGVIRKKRKISQRKKCKKSHKGLRVAIVLGAVIVTIALGRCSPIAPSMDKSIVRKNKDSSGQLSPQPEPNSPTSSSGDSQAENGSKSAVTNRAFSYKTEVMDSDTFALVINEQMGPRPVNQTMITLSETKSGASFKTFKETGKTEFPCENLSSSQEVTSYLEVAVPQRDFLEFDLGSFRTSLELSETTCSLSVATSVNPEVSAHVRAHLVTIALVFTGSAERAQVSFSRY